MTFGLRCLSPACPPHPASPPVRVPAVESLLRASFGFASRLRLAFRYGCRHRPRLAPFIQLDSAHAGHTTCGLYPRLGLLLRNPPVSGHLPCVNRLPHWTLAGKACFLTWRLRVCRYTNAGTDLERGAAEI